MNDKIASNAADDGFKMKLINPINQKMSHQQYYGAMQDNPSDQVDEKLKQVIMP